MPGNAEKRIAQEHDIDEPEAARPVAPAADKSPVGIGDFMSNRPEELLVDLVAFGMYELHRNAAGDSAPAGQRPNVAGLRADARSRLSDYALRHLHNEVSAIRAEAAQSALAKTGRGPGLGTLVLAVAAGALLAGLVAGGLLLWQGALIISTAAGAS
jgi:hypothetical protein